MSTETENQHRQCFDLLAKIGEEYPEGEFDREMIHGDMDFRYRRLKEMRDKHEEFPFKVYAFARFKNALRVPDDAVRSVFNALLKDSKGFSELAGLCFQERRKRIKDWAEEFEIPAGNIDELLTRARLSGILNTDFRLDESYRNVITAYLDL
jgi:hypothetical protein